MADEMNKVTEELKPEDKKEIVDGVNHVDEEEVASPAPGGTGEGKKKKKKKKKGGGGDPVSTDNASVEHVSEQIEKTKLEKDGDEEQTDGTTNSAGGKKKKKNKKKGWMLLYYIKQG